MSGTSAVLDIELTAIGLDPVALPILVTSPVIIAEVIFANPAAKLFAGWLIPEHNVQGVGPVINAWRRVYMNQKQFIAFPNLYTPNDYSLYFRSSEWLSVRQFTLRIFEVV